MGGGGRDTVMGRGGQAGAVGVGVVVWVVVVGFGGVFRRRGPNRTLRWT